MTDTLEDFLSQTTGREFDRAGRPITLGQQLDYMSDPHYAHVGRTEFSDNASVSTVWIGSPSHWDEVTNRPLVFETMAWIDGEVYARFQKPCASEAMQEHCRVVAEISRVLRIPGYEPREEDTLSPLLLKLLMSWSRPAWLAALDLDE